MGFTTGKNQRANRLQKSRAAKSFYLKRFPKDDAFLETVCDMRYGFETVCPHCKKDTELVPHDTLQRKYLCVRCNGVVDPLEGTPFEGKKQNYGKLMYALMACYVTDGEVSPTFLAKVLEIPYPTAQLIKTDIVEHKISRKKRGSGRLRK